MKPGGVFHFWDIDLGELPDTEHEIYIVHLEYVLGNKIKETGYGSRWPGETRGMDYYLALAADAGLKKMESLIVGDTFYLQLGKI